MAEGTVCGDARWEEELADMSDKELRREATRMCV